MPAPGSGNARSEFVKQARMRARNEFGSELERKATDEFCLAVGGPATAVFAEAMSYGGVFAEAMAAPAFRAPAVLELSAGPEAAGELPADLQADLATAVREGVGGALDELSHAETALSVHARQTGVKAAREDFYRRSGQARFVTMSSARPLP